MKRRTFLSIAVSSSLIGLSFGATQIAPSNRVNLFLDSSSPFTTSNWTTATSTTIGTVKVLKSTPNTDFYLSLNMPNLGVSGTGKRFRLDSVSSLGSSQSRISDTLNSVSGQCVDFAKAMIGSTSLTSTWHTGTKISDIPVAQRTAQILPGTMIAYFNRSSTYPADGTGHVAIVLSVTTDGLNVVDQNFVNGFSLKVGTTTYGYSTVNTLIGKHFMPWADTSARRAAGQYHIVDLY